MKQFLLLLTLPGSWACCGSALAADQNGDIAVMGPGSVSCGTRVKERRAGRFQPLSLACEGWVKGYVTAYYAYAWKSNNVANETDENGMFAWLDNYCAHPTT